MLSGRAHRNVWRWGPAVLLVYFDGILTIGNVQMSIISPGGRKTAGNSNGHFAFVYKTTGILD